MIRLRPDVRAVRLDGRTVGLERAGTVLVLTEDVAEAILRRESSFLGGQLGRELLARGFVEIGIPQDHALVDRNLVFADVVCQGGADAALTNLRNHQFVIVGSGGLGSNTAIVLVALGARRIVVTDGDRIEVSNLNRLLWATAATIGQWKSAALARHLEDNYGVTAKPVVGWASEELAREVHEPRREEESTWILTVDEPGAARATARYVHNQPRLGYVHAGYLGRKCIVGPYSAGTADPCPFCESSRFRVSNEEYVAPSAAPNNLMIAAMLVSQLLLVSGRGASASILRGHRWILDLVTGSSRVVPVRKSPSCEVCRQ